jgi:hypothetical protein
MLIRASDFSTLPEGCPVRHGDRETTIAGMEVLYVDLSTPAAIRAFAPALICAVKGLPNAPEQPPVPVHFSQHFYFVLVEYVYGNDAVCWKPSESDIIAATPEACLLAGLKAALDAAKDAQ